MCRRAAGDRAALGRSEVDRRSLAVFSIGLDNFSAVSDEFGAAGADECVVESAARISGGLRPVDTLARVGTSEFAALVEGIARPTNAQRAAHRVLGAFLAPVPVGPTASTEVRISIGITLGRFPDTPKVLIDRAQQAMAQVRRTGGGSASIARSGG